jgi:APA family basic amino acid/polyamine antiporter
MKKEPAARQTFKVPDGFAIPVIAIAVIFWLLSNLSRKEILATAVLIAVVAVSYVVIKLTKTSSRPKV